MRLLTKMRLSTEDSVDDSTEGLTLYKTKIMKKLRLAQLKWSFIFDNRILLCWQHSVSCENREMLLQDVIGRYKSNHANTLWGVIATLRLTWSARVKWRSADRCCCIIIKWVIDENSTLKIDFVEDRLYWKSSLLKIFFFDIMMLYSTLMPPHFELLFFHSFTLSIG